MLWSTKFLTVFLLVQFLASACEDPKDTRNMPSSDDASEEQLASSPAPVTGSYLRCAYIEDPNTAGTTPVGCNPYDENNKVIDLDIIGTEAQWSFQSRLAVTFSKNYVDPKGVRWQGRFDFAANEIIDRATQILETQITLNFLKNGTGQPITLQDKIRNLLRGLAEHRFIKIAYQSIHMNAPAETGLLPDIVDFEFKINGVWEKVNIRLDTLDFAAQTMQSDRFNFKFHGSEVDWKMYLGTGMGKNLANMFADTPEVLVWKTATANGWTFDPKSSFENKEPYNLKDMTRPIELIIDMGMKKSFHGFRLDGGLSNPGRTFPNGFPDRFYFLYSDDNIKWTKIEGSESTLDGRSFHEWSWDM
ncbi:MAG TPA: hypothetical protein VE954_36045 [Oligoflexus sp.]|uniref:hypothetical protein n=1 Tax=Oligoflexus sp. TaxID=1971216 RepID=UPI002D29E6F6|nr:hypothetical protein [Oligoflexus sp.]HYX38546.1 hypothetical protein [Oligoflexus sp.]